MRSLSLQQLIHAPDNVVSDFLAQFYPVIADQFSPIVTLLAILYWVIWGYQLYTGYTAFLGRDLLTKVVVTMMVFAMLQWQGMAAWLYHMIRDLAEGVVSILKLNGQNTTALLEHLWKDVGQMAAFLMEDQPVGSVLQGGGLMLLNSSFVAMVVAYLVMAKMGMAFTMILLPVLIGFFFFSQTKSWAMSWINAFMQFALFFMLVHLMLYVCCLSYETAMADIHDANHALLTDEITMTTTAYVYVIESIFILLMIQVRSWSAALMLQMSGAVSYLSVRK